MTVDLYDGDRLLATTPAARFRQDLLDAHKGDGRHEFAYPTPEAVKDGRPHSIRVLIKGTTFELTPLEHASSPLTCAR